MRTQVDSDLRSVGPFPNWNPVRQESGPLRVSTPLIREGTLPCRLTPQVVRGVVRLYLYVSVFNNDLTLFEKPVVVIVITSFGDVNSQSTIMVV